MEIVAKLGWLFIQFERVRNRCIREFYKSRFLSCGNDVYLGKGCIFTLRNISIGSDVYIGANCVIQSTYGKIIIGNNVMLGPGVNIHGGNHKIREIGVLLKHTSSKSDGDDGTITIEDDVWIGSNAIVLSNVTIGKGSVIGAGSVVTCDIPPYSIYTGMPERKIRPRFSNHELKKHVDIINKIDNH